MRRTFPLIAVVLSLCGAPPALADEAASARQQVAGAATPFDEAINASKAAMMASPDAALAHVQRAIHSASALPEGDEREIRLATAHWLQAEALIRLNRPREAEPVILQALEVVRQVQPGSKLYGDLLMTRASLAGVKGEVRAALQTYQEAHNVYQSVGEDRGRAIALQNIGSIYSDAGDNQRVLQYYAQSAEAYAGDPALNISTHNNRGFAYLDLGQFAEAEDEFQKALALAAEQNSQILEVRIMTNVALAQLGAKKLDEADATAVAALKASTEAAQGWEPFLWGVRAKVAFARGDLGLAGSYIGRTFAAADVDTTTMPFREFHEAAYRIYDALGDARDALQHLEAFKRLDDEARNVAASVNSALASAQFDFANQELSIAKLKAGQLERDIALAAWNSRFLNSLLAAAGVLLTVTFGAFLWIRRSRNQARDANAQLSVVNADLEKALQARTRFLAMTSHEMRTPLNGILGMSQVLLSEPGLNDGIRDRVSTIHTAGHAMRALVEDILDVARIESGQLELEARAFDLKVLLSSVADLWRGKAADKKILMVTDLQHCPARVKADEQRLRQIVYHLLSNAVKFTASGEVRLTASASRVRGEDRLCVRVSDTGIGIPADKLEMIFESFQQVDASVSRQFGGTGLGLSICRSLARAMGGAISVESTPGAGSVFTVDIRLDVLDEPATQPAAPIAPANARNVLLVLANPLTQTVLKAKLAPDFDTIHVLDAWPERAEAQPTGFQLVVLDADVLDGHPDRVASTLQQMRVRNPLGHITVLLHEGAPPRLLSLSERLADQVLVRPVAAKTLVSALKQASGRGEGTLARASGIG